MAIEMARALLLEDEATIAMDVEDALLSAGVSDVTAIRSCEEAKKWLQSNHPDVVILDIHLSDGACDEIVKILDEGSIPYVVHSALARTDSPIFKNGSWLQKPCAPEKLIAAVSAALPPIRLGG